MNKLITITIMSFLMACNSANKNNGDQNQQNTSNSVNCDNLIGRWVSNTNGSYPDGTIEISKINETRYILNWEKNDIGGVNSDCECKDGILTVKSVPLMGSPLIILKDNQFKWRSDNYHKLNN